MNAPTPLYVINDPIVGVGLLRSSASKGLKAIVVAGPGCGSLSFSRACEKYYEIDEQSMETSLVDQLHAIGIDPAQHYFVPAGDIATRAVIAAASNAELNTMLLPELETQKLLSSKDSFSELCDRLGVKTPKTHIRASKHEALELLDQGKACFPLILKPVAMSGGIGVKLVTNQAQMLALLEDDDFDCSPIVIQDYIAGEDVGFCFTAADGVLTASYVQHKTNKGWRFPQLDALIEQSRKILEETKYSGPGNIDAMLDAQGNVFLLEMNARLWASLPVSQALQIDPVSTLRGLIPSNESLGKSHRYTTTTATFSPLRAITALLGYSAMTKQQAASYLLSLVSDPVGLVFTKVPALQRAANQLVSEILRCKVIDRTDTKLA